MNVADLEAKIDAVVTQDFHRGALWFKEKLLSALRIALHQKQHPIEQLAILEDELHRIVARHDMLCALVTVHNLGPESDFWRRAMKLRRRIAELKQKQDEIEEG